MNVKIMVHCLHYDNYNPLSVTKNPNQLQCLQNFQVLQLHQTKTPLTAKSLHASTNLLNGNTVLFALNTKRLHECFANTIDFGNRKKECVSTMCD